jgi:hypothetical protein
MSKFSPVAGNIGFANLASARKVALIARSAAVKAAAEGDYIL